MLTLLATGNSSCPLPTWLAVVPRKLALLTQTHPWGPLVPVGPARAWADYFIEAESERTRLGDQAHPVCSLGLSLVSQPNLVQWVLERSTRPDLRVPRVPGGVSSTLLSYFCHNLYTLVTPS